MQCNLSLYIPSFLKEFKTARTSQISIWAITQNFSFFHLLSRTGGHWIYCQVRFKKQKKVVSVDEFTLRHCNNLKCMQVKRLCASIGEAQLQACPSVLPPFAQNTHLGTEQSCCKHTCVFTTTATTGEFSICTVENLFMRFTAVNESLLLLQRKRTLDLCMPIVETPPNDPFVQKCHLKVQKGG